MPADADFIILDARINLKQWNKAVNAMEADAKYIEKLLSDPTDVKVDVAGLRKAKGELADLDAGVTSEVRFDVTGDDIAGLRSEWEADITTDVKFSQTGDDITGLRDAWDDDIAADVRLSQTGDDIAGMLDDVSDVTVKIKATEDSSVDTSVSSVEKKLDELKSLAQIQLVLDAAGFITDIGSIPLVGALIEIEELTNRVAGQTGRDMENTGRIINNVWTGNWGESKDEIAGVITTVAQMRDATGDFLVDAGNIEEVTVGAFQAASVGGEETLTVLRAASQLIKGGFATDFQDAFDFISLGFSQGLNQSDDMLDSIIEYTTTFEDAQLSANGLFNILSTGMETGVFNTDKMGDAFKEMFNLTKEEVAIFQKDVSDTTDRVDALQELGQLDEAAAFTAGEITGDEFAQGIIDALNEKFEDPVQQDRLAKAIFSPTMVEDAGLGNLLQTDLAEANIWEGQAQALSDEIFSGTGSAFQTMQRTLETHFLNALMNSVEAQEFMDKITVAAQHFGTELAAGASVGEALELALEIPGLADTLHQLESAFGNISIVLLEVAAAIGESFGMEVGDLREDIARFASGQFVFDIQTAGTADELESRITSAINRGVDESEIANLTGQAVQERLEAGDIEGAQMLIDALSQVPDISQVSSDLSGLATSLLETSSVAETASLVGEQAVNVLRTSEERAQFAADEQALLNVPTFDTAQIQAGVNGYVTQLHRELQTAVSASDFDLAQTIGEQLGIQNIEQFISEQEAQQILDALYPKPTENETAAYVNQLLFDLGNAMAEDDFEEGASIANKLMDIDHPGIDALISDFATTLMVKFNNAVGEGDAGEAQNILDIFGLSPEANEVAFASMTQRLATFSEQGVYDIDLVTDAARGLGDGIETSSGKGVEGVDNLYSAITSDKGVVGVQRLGTLAKRFDAVANSIKDTLKQLDEAEEQVGSGAIEGMAVGGVGRAGATLVGERGREMVFADERFAVLNNQTTERLFTALSSMGGMSNNTSNTRNVNYSPTIIVQNDAQAALVGNQGLDQMRGEAF